MIFEAIIGFGLIAFVLAFLYANSPDSRTASGFTFRLVFLLCSLFALVVMSWLMYAGSETTYSEGYDWDGASWVLSTGCNTTVTLSETSKASVFGWFSAWVAVPYLIIALTIIFWLYGLFKETMRKKKEDLL